MLNELAKTKRCEQELVNRRTELANQDATINAARAKQAKFGEMQHHVAGKEEELKYAEQSLQQTDHQQHLNTVQQLKTEIGWFTLFVDKERVLVL